MFNRKLERMKLDSSDEVGKFSTKLERINEVGTVNRSWKEFSETFQLQMKFSNFASFFPTSFGFPTSDFPAFRFFQRPFPTTHIPVGHYQKCKNLKFINRNLLIAISGIYK